ncbi:Inositol phosphoceramide mannosyltransferase 3 [Beauveria bassiana]|nr:Inositol phosphoceramide mannosyltransferase 3 [Beauveria bassiana]KAH8720529.1 Inositol phosphoceramide mannosyltransferase 3 [Beauveria bassiana]
MAIRNRLVGTVVIFGILVTLIAIQQHLHVLLDIARTYSTFYPLLQSHPDLIYRYPAPALTVETPPKIIHSVALGNVNIDRYHDAMASCRQLHSDWEFKHWTDDNATDFIMQHYPRVFPHYCGYYQDIQRANVLRYAVLHHYGGAYLDLDVTCLVALDSTPLMRLPFVSPGAHPAGVNNAFIISQQGHAFLSHLLRSVPSHDLHWGWPIRLPYVENMFSAGCMFFSNMWMSYARALVSGRALDRVHVLGDENGRLAPHMLRGLVTTPLMAHGGASSWHGWDAALILTIGKYYLLVVIAATLAATLVIISLVRYCLCGRVRRRRMSG